VNWNVAEALAPLGERVSVLNDLAQLADAAVAESLAGDRLLVMSNGGFGGIHGKLLERLRERARRAA
jgi:UDP-N-acetylmuramate: L-alanyl-gamma-D-glutamyl-meso-diaminopimelate ligase